MTSDSQTSARSAIAFESRFEVDRADGSFFVACAEADIALTARSPNTPPIISRRLRVALPGVGSLARWDFMMQRL
jgi:hypothetical protein